MNAVYETRFARVGETAGHYQTSTISDSASAKSWALDYLNEYFSERLDQEEFLVICLDTKNRVRRVVRVTRGTLDSSLVHPREVFRPAIAEASAAVILVHNHPGGDPTPSKYDLAATLRLERAGELLGINVLDHIVVGDGIAYSIREGGLSA